MPQVGKIAKLPAHVRDWLHKALVDRAFGDIKAVTAELNELLAREGIGVTVGHSAVGNESLRVRRAQETIAATTRSMQLIAQTARDDADLRGEALNAQLSTELFEVLLDAQQATDEQDPAERVKLLTKASLAAARLTSTSVRQRQWRAEVESKAKAEADAVERIARSGGLTDQQCGEIRARILGIARPAARPPPQAAAA